MMLQNGPLRSEGVQHATEEKQRTNTRSSRANEVVGPKPKGPQLWTDLEVKGKSNAEKKYSTVGSRLKNLIRIGRQFSGRKLLKSNLHFP